MAFCCLQGFPLQRSIAFLPLSVNLIGNGQFLATFGAARCQNSATVGGLHTVTETVLVVSLAVVGLECTFHCMFCFYYLLFESLLWVSGCKVSERLTNRKDKLPFF